MAGEKLSWTNLGPGHDNKQAGLPPTYGQGALQVPGARMTGLVTKMFWGKDESLEGRGELVVVRAGLPPTSLCIFQSSVSHDVLCIEVK